MKNFVNPSFKQGHIFLDSNYIIFTIVYIYNIYFFKFGKKYYERGGERTDKKGDKGGKRRRKTLNSNII